MAELKLKWRNRQTRTVQVRVPARAWGFNSPLEHSQTVDISTIQQTGAQAGTQTSTQSERYKQMIKGIEPRRRADGTISYRVRFRIEKGANPDGGEIGVHSRGQWVKNTYSTVMRVNGKFILDAGYVSGARNMTQSHEGAVTVDGDSAEFVMSGGKITDNARDLSSNGPQYGAANVVVTKGAMMILNDGEIGEGETRTDSAYGETGGISATDGGMLAVNGGKIINNRGGWAGGVGIFGNADVVMNDGTISNNTAPNGGGVNAMELLRVGC